MNYTDVLSLIGGLCLFLFGMQVMGNGLEKRAGSKLSTIIGKLTTNKMMGFFTGVCVTAVIQSSSATTVMVVGFVNSGVMSLKQAINVIMGANVGTTVTAWILSLAGIEGSNFFVSMLKPTNFTPILALIGIVLYLFMKSDKHKDIGMILLGFATLMFGMDTMSASVSGLRDVPEFTSLMTAFSNPILGVLAGALLTAIIQSSSASVGILQALSSTGTVSIGATIPIIFGQNIGTCITALLSSVGTTKNAKRTSFVHLSFNVIGCMLWLIIFSVARIAVPALASFVDNNMANEFSIAVIHSAFNIACTLCLLPAAGLLEKLAIKLVPDAKEEEQLEAIDERLLATPAFAIDRCRTLTQEMAECAVEALRLSLDSLENYSLEAAQSIRDAEDKTDRYEDILGSFLVKLSARELSQKDSTETSKMLHIIGDFERISDHAVNIIESAEEMRLKNLRFTEQAKAEIGVLVEAVRETVDRTYRAYVDGDVTLAIKVEPLEQVIDNLKKQIRARHVLRLQAGDCTLDMGFVLSDLLTNLERVSDHCSNVAGCIVEMRHEDLDLHRYLGDLRSTDEDYLQEYEEMQKKYSLA